MVCEHLSALERELIAAGVEETSRGQAWSENCREWVYFKCVLDLVALRSRFAFGPFVEEHVHRGTHDGTEAGFVCTACKDAVMGRHPDLAGGAPVYR
ncbi:hypothetical protein [Terricaulis sp.]|uniref:hypothetical protein n=1 Tax=Terricaulis sp. TaxID=2768686 RepID=UPI002AC70997|nr:hypothetical protein [Terricaulis sp.]MDZ4690174.1 hypothetical protein [Terricaulis sp.]